MRILLDTHAFLWSIEGQGLSKHAVEAFMSADNDLYLSAASYWEICIKYSLGKLDLDEKWQKTMDREMAVNRIRWLPIEKAHCQRILTLPTIHKDPFDRILIAQAQVEDMTMLTTDANIQKYDISTVW